jgi:ankyrin repeat protein
MKKLILVSFLLLTAAPTIKTQEIFDAVKANDLAKVKALVEANSQLVNAKDTDGRTPLHWACRGVHYELLKFFVEKGADVNAQDNDDIAPLHSLASKAHAEGTALLIAHQADVNVKSAAGDTPLHFAVQSRSIAVVQQLMGHEADVSSISQNGYTPLLRAVAANSLEIAELLMAKGADVNQVYKEDYYGATPMSFAIQSHNLKMAKRLHLKGANIQYRTKLGANHLHFAAAVNEVDVAEYLIESGLDIHSAQNGGLTPLHIAAITGSLDVAKLLVARRAKLDLKSKDGGTALHFAMAARNHEIADFLRQSGAKDHPREFPRYKGKYLGQKAPGAEPELFVPELFRDIYRSYSPPVFSPDGKEVFWTGYFLPWVGYERIWWMREVDGVWTAPELAPFSDFTSWQPALSRDGRKIYFASRRPREGKATAHVDLWYAEKQPDGTWSQAKHLGLPPNRDAFNEMLPSPAKDGTLYFKAFGPDARGTRMYKLKLINGIYDAPVSLDDLIETNGRDDCMDMDHLITYTYGGPKGAVISIIFHKPDGRWTRPVYMGDIIHRGQGTSNGQISPDGKSFFFCQNITPYWIDATFIEGLRKEALKDDKRDIQTRESAQPAVAPTIQARPTKFPKSTGPYLGQTPPGNEPLRFAPGIVSPSHCTITVSPDGKEMNWATGTRIMGSKIQDGRWTKPAVVSFSGQGSLSFHDDVPFLAPDNRKMFFTSRRPLGSSSESKENIWYVERTPAGWSEPRPVSAVVNAMQLHWQVSVSRSGTLYFGGTAEDSFGLLDIYCSKYVNGEYTKPVNLGPVINSGDGEMMPCIAPDESFLIFYKVVLQRPSLISTSGPRTVNGCRHK